MKTIPGYNAHAEQPMYQPPSQYLICIVILYLPLVELFERALGVFLTYGLDVGEEILVRKQVAQSNVGEAPVGRACALKQSGNFTPMLLWTD